MKRIKTSEYRKLSIYGFQISENSHNFYALLEYDITNLRKSLKQRRKEGKGGSLFAFFLKAIAECLKTYPIFNSMIDLRRTTTFTDVDISIPIEIMNKNKIFNKQLIIRNIEKKNNLEIEKEISVSKNDYDKGKTYLPSPIIQKTMSLLPFFLIKAFIKFLIIIMIW